MYVHVSPKPSYLSPLTQEFLRRSDLPEITVARTVPARSTSHLYVVICSLFVQVSKAAIGTLYDK